jgi:hypothetical protein
MITLTFHAGIKKHCILLDILVGGDTNEGENASKMPLSVKAPTTFC